MDDKKRQYFKEYYLNNKTKLDEYTKNYYLDNIDRIRESYRNRSDERNLNRKYRYHNDLDFKKKEQEKARLYYYKNREEKLNKMNEYRKNAIINGLPYDQYQKQYQEQYQKKMTKLK